MNMISLTFFVFVAALFFVLWLCGKTVKSETAYIKLFKTVMLHPELGAFQVSSGRTGLSL